MGSRSTLVALVLPLLSAGCAAKAGRISAAELHDALQLHPHDYVVVDVRSEREWNGNKGHIRGAQHVPFGQMKERVSEIEATSDQTVVLVCFTGHRSQWAMDRVKEHHDGEVVDLRGGMMKWWRKDLPTQREGGLLQ